MIKKTKILYLLTLLFAITFCNVYSQSVSFTEANKVATNFFHSVNPSLDLNSKNTTIKIHLTYIEKEDGDNVFYVFNLDSHKGWVILSGQQNVFPIIAYSLDDTLDILLASQPPAFTSYINYIKAQIKIANTEQSIVKSNVADKWNYYLNFKNEQNLLNKVQSTLPLITATWDQGCYYNALCPTDVDAGYCNHAPTGCVATAMAQIMKYWNFPTVGKGSHTYNFASYTNLSADFGSTTYNWVLMPNKVISANSAVATLMYHCGISVGMGYAKNGSSSFMISSDSTYSAQSAFIRNFGYDSYIIRGLNRSSYSDANWIQLIKNEIDSLRPVQYSGFDPKNGGHSFVCDGYDANNLLHMNWGWSGQFNGYFNINNLAAGGSAFNNSQQAIVGIRPCLKNNFIVKEASNSCANDGEITTSNVCGTTPFKYKWSTGDTTQSVSGLSVGNYSATITDVFGSSEMLTTTVNYPKAITINPNPVIDDIIVGFPDCSAFGGGSIQIYSVNGRLIKKLSINSNLTTINISTFPSGMYVVKVIDVKNSKVAIKKIIKV